MRFNIGHYFNFKEDRTVLGEELDAEGWDALRVKTSGPFALAPTRAEWERTVDDHPELAERARLINEVLDEHGAGSLASYGVGAALLELWLHRQRPQRKISLTEYTPATVDRLREIFPETETHQHDMLADPPLKADWHLFHRLDAVFSNRQWRGIMRKFQDQRIVFVAAEIIGWRQLVDHFRPTAVLWRRRNTMRVGTLRNRASYQSLWRRTHRSRALDLGDLEGWVLEPRR